MSDAVLPTSIPADGSLLVLWVPTLADPAEPTLAELTAPTVIDLTCYLTADGWAPATDEQVSTDSRLCSRQDYERAGRFTDSLEITYVYQGQEPAAADNKAQSVLRHKELGYVYARYGMDFELPLALGDIGDVIPAECGIQRKQPPVANERLKIMQKIFVRGATRRDTVVVAS
jgi:hypothetical protein